MVCSGRYLSETQDHPPEDRQDVPDDPAEESEIKVYYQAQALEDPGNRYLSMPGKNLLFPVALPILSERRSSLLQTK